MVERTRDMAGRPWAAEWRKGRSIASTTAAELQVGPKAITLMGPLLDDKDIYFVACINFNRDHFNR